MSSSNAIGDSFWKPPMLNPGEYDWWTHQIEAHICSLDGQLWRVIKQGPIPIMDEKDPTKAKDEKDYTDADYKALEKNNRAKKVLYQALSQGDMKKIMKYKTANEIWEGLKRLYGGNQDIQRNRILAAAKDYENALQGKNESLEDFHTRFQTCVGQMEFLGESIPEWKVTHQFLQALNSKWDGVTLALQAQSDIKEITLEELVARLQSNAGVLERKMARREPDRSQAVALKIERAFDLAQGDDSDDDGEDETTVLLTRAFRMAGSRGRRNASRGNASRGNTEQKRDLNEDKDRLCYHCQRTGHLVKDCIRKKRGDPPSQKNKQAMMALWGETDSDSGDDKSGKEPCLMAGTNTSEVLFTDPPDDKIYTSAEYVDVIRKLLVENDRLNKILLEKDEEIAGADENNQLWAQKAMRLEDEKLAHKCRCRTYEGRINEISDLKSKVTQPETDN